MTAVRIAPGTRRDTGTLNALIAGALGVVAGSNGPPHLFTTLARHRRLFRPWLRFAGALMPRGAMARRDSELLILRVASNCNCEYERRHHEHIAVREGMTEDEVARVARGPQDGAWGERDRALLEAADELHAHRTISSELWAELGRHLSEVQLIELCMLVGHYEMLAMTINSLGVAPDEIRRGTPSALMRMVGRRR